MPRALRWRVPLVLAVVAGAIWVSVTQPIRLGLDLRGGTQIVLEAQDTETVTADADATSRALEVLRRRVDALGVSEPTLQRSGDRRIIVELPGVDDPEEAVEVIGRTAQLSFHPVLGTEAQAAGEDDRVLVDEDGAPLRIGPAALLGDAVDDARARLDPGGVSWVIEVDFADGGTWAALTGAAACIPPGDPQRRVAIVLDEQVLVSPPVGVGVACGTGIAGGSTVISGSFGQEEAQDLALLIRAGALPVPVEIVEQRTVGPTLGEAAIEASVQAALIGATLTILFLLAYYRLLGVLAAIALGVYGLVSLAALQAIGATLTLPGIAGFVLAIGMAVDGNVLVFERIKEEHARGRSLRASVRAGFDRALSAIADSNATTLIAAVILYYFASGGVRGFGVTLSIGVLTSMFTALVVTRVLIELAVRNTRSTRSTRGDAAAQRWGMAVGEGFRTRVTGSGYDVVARRRLWFAISLVAVLVAGAGIAVRGVSYGIEFTGGRLIELSTAEPADVDDVRAELADAGLPRAVVQASGDGNVSIRTRELDAGEEQAVVDAVEAVGGPAERVRDEFVGPTIGDELRTRALIALGLALAAQLAYLAVRFRWTYGAATVVAMFHDVAIVVGVFAWLGKELDGVFVAALLTVIGYSVNDSVVIFDRIRERRAAQPGGSFSRIANDAALETLPRTVNTGLSTLFILVALWLLGGETLADFALALIVGILIGTYSSVLTAMPIATVLEGDRAAVAPPGVAPSERGATADVGSQP